MRRYLPSVLFAAVAMTVSAPALAQNCPPGAWFCEEAAPPPPPAARPSPRPQIDESVEVEEQEAPPPQVDTPRDHRRPVIVHTHRRYRGAHPPPPVVVYQPGRQGPPPQVVIVAPGAAPPQPRVVAVQTATPPPPPLKPRRWHRRWGLNLRLEGASFAGEESGAAENAGMGGVGMSLRFRPVPAFAFDLGVDVLSGTDWNGFQRTEMPVSLSGMLFVNPRSRVQFYLLGGMHYSHAEVESDTDSPLLGAEGEDFGRSAEYTYFGGHGGIGLEFRISRLVALNVDMLGFMRKRTDDGGKPEFVEAGTGRETNKSGGGLFRGGLTFWW
jgi:hypothetical protein